MGSNPTLSAILVLTSLVTQLAAQSLPATPAESLNGQKMEFPAGLRGQVVVCIFTFSREAGEKVREWTDPLLRDSVNVLSIANLEGAPGFIRGMIRSGMRKGAPASEHARMLVMTRDTKAWKAALGVTQDSLPVVALLDSTGRLVWTRQSAFDSAVYAQLKTQLSRLAPRP